MDAGAALTLVFGLLATLGALIGFTLRFERIRSMSFGQLVPVLLLHGLRITLS